MARRVEGWLRPQPLLGSGAGTFAALWNRYRPTAGDALVAHSLYVGTLGDLGLVGAALLFAALVAITIALTRHARRGGLACVRSHRLELGDTGVHDLAVCRRWAGCVARSSAGSSHAHLRTGLELESGRCGRYAPGLAVSREAVGQRPEPDMVLAYCAAREGRNTAALGYAAAAVHRDPGDWEVHYAQALVQAAAGEQPRAALRAAALRNPLDSYVANASTVLDRAPAPARRGIALSLPLPLAVRLCGGPTRADEVAPCGDPALPILGPGIPVATRRP